MAIKLKEIRFYEPMYQANICYLIGGTADDLIKYIKNKHGNDKMYSWDKEFSWGEDANTTDAYQFHINALLGQGETFYIWVHKPTASLIFHETYHLIGDILHTRGIEYSYSSEESYAYLGGWIFSKFSSLFNKRLKAE